MTTTTHNNPENDSNVVSSGQLTNLDELKSIISCFPSGVDYAFGYGSGVFAQQSSADTIDAQKKEKEELPMIDLILSVKDPNDWHEKNLKLHPYHYAPLCRTLGSNFITSIQKCGGAKAFFNPLVQSPVNYHDDAQSSYNIRKIKYGIVHTPDLKDDLLQWKYLYIAGRLHKPTVQIPIDETCIGNSSNSLENEIHHDWQLKHNLNYAMASALLMISSNDTKQILKQDENPLLVGLPFIFEKIASLSYVGDPRMKAGAEDPDKVRKLVNSPGQYERFLQLYQNTLLNLEQSGLIQYDQSNHLLDLNNISNSKNARRELWNFLPPQLSVLSKKESFQKNIVFSQNNNRKDKHMVEKSIDSTIILSNAMENIVAPAARYQSMKGIITAGFVKSFQYAMSKFSKGIGAKLIKLVR